MIERRINEKKIKRDEGKKRRIIVKKRIRNWINKRKEIIKNEKRFFERMNEDGKNKMIGKEKGKFKEIYMEVG